MIGKCNSSITLFDGRDEARSTYFCDQPFGHGGEHSALGVCAGAIKSVTWGRTFGEFEPGPVGAFLDAYDYATRLEVLRLTCHCAPCLSIAATVDEARKAIGWRNERGELVHDPVMWFGEASRAPKA